MRSITVEATAVCKGVEMTHGNSFHYLTFELDSGERVYFQVSMKSFMLIVEGDRCLITYRSLTNSPKKKLKSFERIGKGVAASVVREVETPLRIENEPMQMLEEPVQPVEVFLEEKIQEIYEEEEQIQIVEEFVQKPKPKPPQPTEEKRQGQGQKQGQRQGQGNKRPQNNQKNKNKGKKR